MSIGSPTIRTCLIIGAFVRFCDGFLIEMD